MDIFVKLHPNVNVFGINRTDGSFVYRTSDVQVDQMVKAKLHCLFLQ